MHSASEKELYACALMEILKMTGGENVIFNLNPQDLPICKKAFEITLEYLKREEKDEPTTSTNN